MVVVIRVVEEVEVAIRVVAVVVAAIPVLVVVVAVVVVLSIRVVAEAAALSIPAAAVVESMPAVDSHQRAA